jgi:hypothetical protein
VKEKLQKAFVFSLKFVPFVMIFSCLWVIPYLFINDFDLLKHLPDVLIASGIDIFELTKPDWLLIDGSRVSDRSKPNRCNMEAKILS